MKLRFFGNLMVVLFWMGLISSCKQSPSGQGNSDGKITIRYLTSPDVGQFSKEMISRFEELNPNIHVEMVEGPTAPNTREDMYAASFMAKEDTYDMLYMDIAWLPKFAAQGWLRPLDDWFGKEAQSQFLKGDIEGSIYQGKLYRVPTQSDGGMLYYRKDLLQAKGFKAPQTWEQLVKIAKELQSPPDVWGFVFQGKQYEGLVCDYMELAWGNQATLMDDQGNVHIDSPGAIEALEWLVKAVHEDKISPPGVLTYQEEEARHMFQEGKAIFMRNWPYAWNLLQDEKSPVKGKIGIVPMVHGVRGQSAATLGGWGYGISSFSKNPQAAWKFIEFASSAENQKFSYFKSGILPTRRALFDDADVVKASPHMKVLGQVLSQAKARPAHPSYARISDILQVHLSAALSLQEKPKLALANAAKEIRSVLKQ